jgi:hypothetical protein
MADITDRATNLGSQLSDLLLCDDLEPGAEPSYQVCKAIYLYHPLGSKMVDAPIKMAQSQAREVSVPGAPKAVVEAFMAEWASIKADDNIFQTASVARTYGIGSVVLGCVGKDTKEALTIDELAQGELFFNVADPLNTAGSLVMNQDPNAATFQKHTQVVINGQTYHRSRSCVIMNEKPVYIAYTGSAFGFVGRSVYQRALFPLKTFVQSMITDDMVTQKVGLLVVKLAPAGGIIDNLMAGFAAVKRVMLKGARTGNVLTISAGSPSQNDESIESLNLMNIDGAGGWARTNVLKNIATAADMPAVLLENETLTEGFGEGTEDAKIIAGYIDTVRKWLGPLYDWFDPIVQRRAWNPDFYKTIQERFPAEYGKKDYKVAYYEWVNAFNAVWPNLLKEPESEAVETEKVKYECIIGVLEAMIPEVDPDNKAVLFQWAADNLNKNEIMFTTPLVLDWQALANYTPQLEQGGDEGDGGGGGGLQRPKPPRPKL